MRGGLPSPLARRLAAVLLHQGARKQAIDLPHGFAAGGSAGGGGASTADRQPWLVAIAAGLSAGLGVQLYSSSGGEPAECKAADQDKDGLRVFTREEVAKHRTKADRVWVTYKARSWRWPKQGMEGRAGG